MQVQGKELQDGSHRCRGRLADLCVDHVDLEGQIVAIAPEAAMVAVFAALDRGVSARLVKRRTARIRAAVCNLVETGENRTPRPERVDRRSTPGEVDALIPCCLDPRRPGSIQPAGFVLGAPHTGGRSRSTSTYRRPFLSPPR